MQTELQLLLAPTPVSQGMKELCRTPINKHPPIHRGYRRNPNIVRPLRGGGFMNHGSTLFRAKLQIVGCTYSKDESIDSYVV